MTTVDVDDRDGRLASIVAGEGAFERGTGFEPNLLPALAERGSASLIGQVIAAADMFGREDRHPDAWPYLRERTMLVVLRRFGRDDLLGLTSGETDPTEVDVWRASEGQSFDLDAVRTRLATGDDWRYPQLSARLLAADGDVGAIRSFCERHEGRDLDPIAVRMLAESAAAHGAPLPTPWLDAAIGDAGDGLPLGRIAHLLPLVADGDRRRALVVETVGRLTGRPPWFASLVAAAIGDEAPHHVVDELLGADLFPPVWRALVRASFAATPATSPDDVVDRSHPFHARLPDEAEVTGEMIAEMVRRWGHAPTMAAPDGPVLPTDPASGPSPSPVTSDPASEPEPAAPEPESAPEPSEPPTDDRRLGIGDVTADGVPVERALIRGARTKIRVSIGPPGTADHQLATPVNAPFPTSDPMRFPVTLFDADGAQTGEIELWPNPASIGNVEFDVNPQGDRYHATIVVYRPDGSTVIQAASFAARVVADVDAEARAAPSMQFVEVAAGAIGGGTDGRVGSVVVDSGHAVVSSPGVPIRALPSGAIAGIAPLLARFRTAAANSVATGVTTGFTEALVEAARLGFRIRDDLGLDELADMHRIQIVALYAGAVFPLELVYDGQPPEEGATLCTAWTDAPVGGDCPNCTDLGDTSVVCPQRFWALSKHIEHHHPESGATDPVSAPFVAREHFRDGSPIPAPTRALVGASVEVYNALRVSPDDPDADAAARIEALGEAFADVVSVVRTFGECDVAADWDDWKAAIAAGGPGLLIAMPHQAGDSVTEASLEMGGAAETTFVERHIRTPGATPGPIVLLLGCDTSNAPTLLSSFASRMRKYAPVVVATIGRVIAAEAPHVAATVVRHLRTAAEADSGVAAALIAARRELLAESRLVGLQLIAHGDARWDFG